MADEKESPGGRSAETPKGPPPKDEPYIPPKGLGPDYVQKIAGKPAKKPS